MNGKRVELDPKFEPKKCQKRYDNGMSKIYDDIIIKILSCLPLKEAVRTSVLSSRWINLWKHTPHLNFDLDSALKSKIAEPQEFRSFPSLEKFVEEERRKYVDWVNTVLQYHKAPILEEFIVCFELSRSHQDEITRWLQFAFAKKVRRLELDLKLGFYVGRPFENYSFPEELLTRIDFQSLRELSLKYVNVTGEAIEFFLLKCPLLKKFVFHGTAISNLQVCGELLMLKHLELDYLNQIESVKVSAPNLSSLTVPMFKGLSLKNVPMLVEVSVNCRYGYSIKDVFPALSCCISRLEILHLKLHYAKKNVEDRKSLVHHKFPELLKLKKLFIRYCDTGDESLIGLTSLIRASPNLHEFGLELIWQDLSRSHRKIEIMSSMKHFHQSLKVFKFRGYYGRVSDVELVMFISANCIAIEKIIIDPRNQLPLISFGQLDGEQTIRKIANQQLEGKLAQHIDLVIL